jgi:hypothetical protein
MYLTDLESAEITKFEDTLEGIGADKRVGVDSRNRPSHSLAQVEIVFSYLGLPSHSNANPNPNPNLNPKRDPNPDPSTC